MSRTRAFDVFAATLAIALTAGAEPRTAAATLDGLQGHGADTVQGAREDRSTESELEHLVSRYTLDRQALLRRHDLRHSPDHRQAMQAFYEEWRARLAATPFDTLSVEGRIDHVLLVNRIAWERQLLDRQGALLAETASLLPFAATIAELHDRRRRMETLDPRGAAATLDRLTSTIEWARAGVEAGLSASAPPTVAGGPAPIRASRVVALRAAEIVDDLTKALGAWHASYSGYDPLFTWWAAAPYKKAEGALKEYGALLRRRIVGVDAGGEEPIVGDPIGREALVRDLAFELIPYTPEELLAIAEREFAWCEEEMRRAAREMGVGDDWRAALEKVKTLHVEPGRQPEVIRDLAREAEAYVERHDLITVPPLAREVWRLEMMSPERQKVNPFFTGGEVISVSFPTDTMSHEDKLMSLRGNNVHFARATVFHELIPGHHLQGFMTARHNAHRRAFATPFWGEGWALYWEMLLWDRGFQRSPEDRVGMLFWRAHRAARIIFSLRFHMGTMTPEACIDFLVDRVGHERANAAAEVRRSFNGTYPPLYQLAYMIGGLQFRALHRDLVGTGSMSDRQFHDAVITGGSMPVEMVRARLTKQAPARDHRPAWRFAGEPLAGVK